MLFGVSLRLKDCKRTVALFLLGVMGVCCTRSTRDQEIEEPSGVETVSTQRGSGTQRSYHASDEARRVPLRKVRPEPHVNSWTLAELGRQREEFWHTRVENVAEIWSVIRVAAEMMEEDVDGCGLANAECYLEAANIKTHSGLLTLCYDELGNEYNVPTWCLATPTNVLVGAAADAEEAKQRAARQPSAETRQMMSGVDQNPGSILDLAVRIGGVIEDIRVSIGENEYVDTLKRKVLDCRAPNQNLPTSELRLFFYGQELPDARQLKSCRGIESDVVIIGVLSSQ